MLRTGRDQVDAGSFDAAVAQHVGQLWYIPADPVKRPGEQMPEIVREHLGGRYSGLFTEGFHLHPNLLPGHSFSVSGRKVLTGGGFVFPGVFQ